MQLSHPKVENGFKHIPSTKFASSWQQHSQYLQVPFMLWIHPIWKTTGRTLNCITFIPVSLRIFAHYLLQITQGLQEKFCVDLYAIVKI
jgi:hypothetical protein